MSQEVTVRLYLQNSDIVMIIALALLCSLLLAIRFRPSSWKAIMLEALAANAAAIVAVVAKPPAVFGLARRQARCLCELRRQASHIRLARTVRRIAFCPI
jgi:hypothetical protein